MTAISDRLLAVEARLDGAEARLLYLSRFVDEVASLGRRVHGAEVVASRHRPQHGRRVLGIGLRYVLGSSASHLTERPAP